MIDAGDSGSPAEELAHSPPQEPCASIDILYTTSCLSTHALLCMRDANF